MKKYKVGYFKLDKSNPYYITELFKSGGGVMILFCIAGKKCWQGNWKNNILNGIDKAWLGSANSCFQNWKKGNRQGVQIKFK